MSTRDTPSGRAGAGADRGPYVGDGADGARRSAQIDREEADCLPLGEARDRCLASAQQWDRQARHLDRVMGEGL
ncbi:MAG: hypothetical protein L0H96_24705 [Humibacillus sp.]|nr:hypothetical protein [Humibacillus sp.]MDN5780084.1 hypothetical protein [Humibacillus sp.]